MGTLQNPNPNPHPYPYPYRTPLPNLHPTSNPSSYPTPASKPSPSFEEVSKLFSLPLSDAADSLGVCPTVLKKVCYDNGFVRWPYRKFVAGKSIEEIKKDAAIEKEKQLAASKVAGERNDSLARSVVSSSLAPQSHSTSTAPLQGSPTSRIIAQQPTKDNQINSPHNTLIPTMNKGSPATVDEFKYGFPSAGLSSVSFRWWGNKGDVSNGTQQSGDDNAKEMKQQCEDSADIADTNSSSKDAEAPEGKEDEIEANTQWAGLLTSLRKKSSEEGRRALKLGIYRGLDGKTLDRTKKMVLLQIFKSSLPEEWGDLSSES